MSEIKSSEIWLAFPYIDDLDAPRCMVSRGTVFDSGCGRKAVAYNEGRSVWPLGENLEHVFPSEGYALLHCARYMREKSAIFAAEADRLLAAAVATEIVVVT